jgi:hypothetical protein
LHYLSDGFHIDVVLPAALTKHQLAALEQIDFSALKRTLGAREIRLAQTVQTHSMDVAVTHG